MTNASNGSYRAHSPRPSRSTKDLVGSNPALWKEVGTDDPTTILGSDLLSATAEAPLTVNGGTVIGSDVIDLGSGVNTIRSVNRPPGDRPERRRRLRHRASRPGARSEAANSVADRRHDRERVHQGRGQRHADDDTRSSGLLSDTNRAIKASIVSMSARTEQLLLIAADPANETSSTLLTPSSSPPAHVDLRDPAAQVGLTLLSVQFAAGGEVQHRRDHRRQASSPPGHVRHERAHSNNAPWLYTATPKHSSAARIRTTAGASEIQLTVTRRTPQQLGFNARRSRGARLRPRRIPAERQYSAGHPRPDHGNRPEERL